MNTATAEKVFTAVDVGTAMMKAGKTRMTQEQSGMFITCTMRENNRDGKVTQADMPAEITDSFLWQVFDKRLRAAGGDVESISNELRMFILFGLCKSVGDVVMWAAAVTTMQFNKTAPTMSGLVDAFPDGFPSAEDMNAIWDQQKRRGHPDNWLDTREAWL